MTRRSRRATLALHIVGLIAILAAGCGDEVAGPLSGAKEAPEGVPIGPRNPDGFSLGAVPDQLICRVSSGASISEIHAIYGTTTIAVIPGTPTYLIAPPEGVSTDALLLALTASTLCAHAEPNQLLENPEAEQRSLAYYEGTFGHEDYVDQLALARIGAGQAHGHSTGSGVLVAVIDTGADLDHPDLADNLSPNGYDFVDEDLDPADLPNYLDDDQDGFVDEATGHGSHVAGIVAATAPDVTILPLRALDSDGIGDSFDVTRAIYFAINSGARVINLSLGLSESVEAMKRAIQAARDADILVVASAGNRGVRDHDHFPAGLSEVMAVAATDAFDQKAVFSSYGSHISVSAPGVGIMSTYWNGGYAVWSGTSMAAPFVAGAGALRLAVAPADPGTIQQVIEDTSVEFGNNPYRGEIGKGRIDLLALVLANGKRGSALLD